MKLLLSLILSLSLSCALCPAHASPAQFDLSEESLQQTYPFTSQQVSFLLFGKDGDISNLDVRIADIKDPNGKSLPPEYVTVTYDKQGKVTTAGTKVTLTVANPEHFVRAGSYKIFLRLQGSTMVSGASTALPILPKPSLLIARSPKSIWRS